ncbi:Na+/H+ antiporter [Phenylobacterium deserti]|uniref:Na+/H+ antiporter n=1 Tax=Phenylobacterium deserti TaxID=1914756 RepID=A0A328ACA9_9CAUL|nr:Na+/H+ antiporter [Phenylobacterium deserti]RAK52443.1 Na+/H+ antiporter [Phenylobacterium deserti]
MEELVVVLILLAAVVLSGALARATRIALPLVQIMMGAAIALSPIETVVLDPELFFVLFLPPLLFLDGWRIPKGDLFRDRAVIVELALGLVVLTVAGLGMLIHWMIPAMPLPVAFALAAIVSPTDPIAVSAVAARAPIPRRMMHILEGESLLNDASGLVCMRFAVAAMLTGAFSLVDAVQTFAWLAVGGVAIGVATAFVITRLKTWASARLGEDSGSQIIVSLLIPFAAYLSAEHFHCSGILAAVAAGITMSFAETGAAMAVTRVRRTAVWDTVQFAANGAIFVLLGEQMPNIVAGAAQTVRLTGHAEPWWLAVYVLAIVAALAALRFAWVWTSLRLTWFRAGLRGEPRRNGSRRLLLAMSLAGVRGAITLAGILTLPLTLNDGTPFPARDLAIFLAAGVIVVTLLIATFALPPILRGLELPPHPSVQAREDAIRVAAAEAAIQAIEAEQHRLAEGRPDADLYAEAAGRVMELYRLRIDRRGLDPESRVQRRRIEEVERRLRVAGLGGERARLFEAGRSGELPEDSVRRLVREIDLLEARYSAGSAHQ